MRFTIWKITRQYYCMKNAYDMVFATCYMRLFSGSFKNWSKARLINSEIFIPDFSDSSFSRASCEDVMYMFILFMGEQYTVFSCTSRKKLCFSAYQGSLIFNPNNSFTFSPTHVKGVVVYPKVQSITALGKLF